MFETIVNRKLIFAVKSGIPDWREKDILSQDIDNIANVTLAMDIGDINTGTPSTRITQVWIITPVQDSNYFEINTASKDKCLTVASAETDKLPLSIEEPNGSLEQQWIISLDAMENYQFESAAYQGKFLAKVAGDEPGQGIAVVSSLADEDPDDSDYVLVDWTIIPTEDLVYSSQYFFPKLFTPVFEYLNTTSGYNEDEGQSYQQFSYNSDSETSQLAMSVVIPIQLRQSGEVDFSLSLKHAGGYNGDSNQWTAIDIFINGRSFLLGFVVDSAEPTVQTLNIPFGEFDVEGINVIDIKLGESTGAAYWLYDIQFTIENPISQQSLGRFINQKPLSDNVSGCLYSGLELGFSEQTGNFCLSFEEPDSMYAIKFFVPKILAGLEHGQVTIILNQGVDEDKGQALLSLTLNDEEYISDFSVDNDQPFARYMFTLSFRKLLLQSVNTFEIRLSASNSGRLLLSDAGIVISTQMPEINEENYDRYVKDWILAGRRNIDELSQIPRDDIDALGFMLNAPAWFYLPFLPASFTEISVLIRHFPVNFYFVAQEVKGINKIARDFRRDLLASDLPRKNALRHALWMALITRQFNAEFALDLGNAHEYAHVDLTIEGPFDHVTDKINNLIGVSLAKNNPSSDCQLLVESAWENGKLAWAKNFRVEDEVQTADVYWQMPLDSLMADFGVTPDFNELELATLSKCGVTIDGGQSNEL